MHWFSNPNLLSTILFLVLLAFALLSMFIFKDTSLKETLILGCCCLCWYTLTLILINHLPQLDVLGSNKSLYLTLSLIGFGILKLYLDDKLT